MDRETNTLALHGLEEPFFQLCCCVVSVFGSGGKKNLGSPCQDMKPGPQVKLMYYYFYHGSNLREIIRFLREIECIEFECYKFVVVLVQIDLIHFEHSVCISST
jgi:hypothetical protein